MDSNIIIESEMYFMDIYHFIIIQGDRKYQKEEIDKCLNENVFGLSFIVLKPSYLIFPMTNIDLLKFMVAKSVFRM